MVAGPDPVVVRLFGNMIVMIVAMMMAVTMGMAVVVPMQGVIVRHVHSLACYRRKIS